MYIVEKCLSFKRKIWLLFIDDFLIVNFKIGIIDNASFLVAMDCLYACAIVYVLQIKWKVE